MVRFSSEKAPSSRFGLDRITHLGHRLFLLPEQTDVSGNGHRGEPSLVRSRDHLPFRRDSALRSLSAKTGQPPLSPTPPQKRSNASARRPILFGNSFCDSITNNLLQ